MLYKSQSQSRIESIDIIRGAVMAIMALDHIREFLHSAALSFSPEDLTRTTPAIFFTRWITHFCAPVFMFTAGLGAFLWAQRGKSRRELSWFLWTRGLWLIVLELTVGRLGMYFNFDYSFVMLLVLWALGCSMIALAALVYLPPIVLVGVSVAMIALHDLLDGIKASQFGSAAWAWNVLHQPGIFHLGTRVILVAYPLIPWIGVMAAGYCCGRIFLLEPARRKHVLVRLGVGLTIGFLLLRALNVYGDPVRWSTQHSALFTVLSFLKCSKYPPSLDFLLMTLGPAIAVMGWLEHVRLSATNPLLIFGRVPLFYYVVHLFVIHGIAMLLAIMRYGRANFLLNPPPTMSGFRQAYPADYGYDLWVCYAVWLAVLVLMYPLCRWFSQLKQRQHDWWWGYL
jgi:uncharacterized membrane protein